MDQPLRSAHERAQIAARAAGLARTEALERAAAGQTAEVWYCGAYVLRINAQPGSQRLRREMALMAQLPPGIPYPPVVAHGAETDFEWAVQLRLPGERLARLWPAMNDAARRQVVAQLAVILRTLHASHPALPELADPPQVLGAGQMLDLVRRSRGLRHVDAGLLDRVEAWIAGLPPLDDQQRGLIHGDLHFDNLLWDGQAISGLLDFEYARLAPIDLELDIFLRFAAYPYLFVVEGDEADETLARPALFAGLPGLLRDAYPVLFAQPQLLQRLMRYALAYDLTLMQRYPPGGPLGSIAPHHPYRRIWDLFAGESYLGQWIG